MHRFRFLAIAVVALAACTPSTPVVRLPEPAATAAPTLPASAAPTSLALSSTYRDDENGFELDYPSDWTLVPNTVIGSRGSQAQLLSPGTTAEKLASGGSRLSITIYLWDPKGDLGAYIAHRRSAWEGSGFKVRDGSITQLSDGRPASDFIIQAPDGLQAYVLLASVGDQYLELAGEGDLSLLESISQTLRPLTPQ